MEAKTCESCGMPMVKTEDFGGGNSANPYCRFCTYEDGSLKPYEVKVEELARFVMDRTGATFEQATKTAKDNLAKMPAWRDVVVQ